MKTRITLFLTALVVAAFSGIAQPAIDYDIDTDGDGSPEGTLYHDVVYDSFSDLILYNDFLGSAGSLTYAEDVELYDGTLTDLKLDLYYADYGSDTLAARDKPVIFFFYGGGFVEGNSIRVKDLCLQYAQRGYVTVAPNYRLGFNGAYETDSISVCEDLIGPAQAAYRGLLDAQQAMRWVRDNAASLGLDVDPDNFFVHGPSFFPVLSHMQNDEVPGVLSSLGALDDAVTIKASVGRSAALNLIDLFVDADDTAPFMIFHGTCDKSVAFFKSSTYKRFGCDTVIDPSLVNDYAIYGSYFITQQVSHYYEWYPICGLNHSLKDIEEIEMRQPMADFFYKNVTGEIDPMDPPVIKPFIQAPCEISSKCKFPDYYAFCDSAEQLPPRDGPCRLADFDLDFPIHDGVGQSKIGVFPNPSRGDFYFTYQSPAEKTANVFVYDLLGRQRELIQVPMAEGVNVKSINLDLEPGVYFIGVDGVAGPRFVIED